MDRKRTDSADPYAPPPRYRDRSGRLVRVGLMALLLAGLGVGYFAWSATTPQQAALAPQEQQQQLADAGYRAQPEQIPQAQPVSPTPSAATPAPDRRRQAPSGRSSRSAPEPQESAPPPVSDVPTTPAPIPPAATAPQMPDSAPPAQG